MMAPSQSSQERLQVLRMIDEGKITAEEGFQLLKVLDSTDGASDSPRPTSGVDEALKGKLVRLQVIDLESGRSKATASVPLRLLEVGLRIATHYAPGLKHMNPDSLLDALGTVNEGRIIEIVDEEQKTRIELRVE